ncbi:PepSY-associated TM helix domain-containing protein [Jiulongibacter sp. NS-SX5]|uniref:PepSY-associated TM helix domain-containing protein n=1 Tax=Jiulongibacter sp. NS-SX5 TaxID=3463854 RepID=UPI00405A0191
MKLKGLPNRVYNILFHTHTVSGIVLSFGLFIIFYAGAFALFKSEIAPWENPQLRRINQPDFSLAKTLETLKQQDVEIDWHDDIRIYLPSEELRTILVRAHLQHEDGPEIHYDVNFDPKTYEVLKHENTTGETIYRLHFFDQIPLFGRYLAGFTALFFLFASVTGVLIHWRNLFTKFWSFSIKKTWKQMWSNAHTALGFLGLPFQMMYAITGAFYLLLPLILLPSLGTFFNGDINKLYAVVYPSFSVQYKENAPMIDNEDKLLALFTEVEDKYQNEDISYIGLKHYNKKDGFVEFAFKSEEGLDNRGTVGYRINSGEELYNLIPDSNKPYHNKVLHAIGQLHFGTFGGVLLKVIYFILSLLTCFVIIAGVLLWRESRKNKSYSDKQKLFHRRVTTIYLSVCLSLIPAFPMLFISDISTPQIPNHNQIVNSIFFGSWFIFTVIGVYLKSDSAITKFFLKSGGILAILVPFTNGIITGDWIWQSISFGEKNVFWIDTFWLLTGLFCFYLGIYKPQNELKRS